LSEARQPPLFEAFDVDASIHRHQSKYIFKAKDHQIGEKSVIKGKIKFKIVIFTFIFITLILNYV
jgi:hypothetical protein